MRAVERAKKNQTLVPVPMKQDFIDAIAKMFPQMGYSNRSDFIRDAVIEKINRHLKERGLPPLAADMATAPSRIGKGGRPTHKVAGANLTTPEGVGRATQGLANTFRQRPANAPKPVRGKLPQS